VFLFTVAEVEAALKALQARGIVRINTSTDRTPEETVINIQNMGLLDNLLKQEKDTLSGKSDFVETPLPYDARDLIFVMMPFSDEFWKWLDGTDGSGSIREAVEKLTGYKCVTVADDKTDHRIEDKIYTHIKKAAFCIGNISEINPSVFYELGIAHSLGRRVIMVCDESAYQKHLGLSEKEGLFGKFLKSVFDVNHRTIVRCENKERLLPELEEAIKQTLKVLGRDAPS